MEPDPEEVSAYAEWLDNAERIAAALARSLDSQFYGTQFQVKVVDQPGSIIKPYYQIDATRLRDRQSARVVISEDELLSKTLSKKDYADLVGSLRDDVRKLMPDGSPMNNGWYEATGRETIYEFGNPRPIVVGKSTLEERLRLYEGAIKQVKREEEEKALKKESDAAINSIYAAHEAQARRKRES